MHTLFPPIKPYAQHELSVGKPHVLYIEETGDPAGVPVIYLHPGPGAGGDTHGRRLFDPERYRIILFDQRGCGRSKPHASIQNNTTQTLIDDIEAIRDHLKLDRFLLAGGGWGALLALLYAQTYPHGISALLLHQVFLGRADDIQWFYQNGANHIYPDYWEAFIQLVPPEVRPDILSFYATTLQGSNELARMAAAKQWALWQARCSSLQPHLSIIDQYSDPHFALALATLTSYYLTHHYFIEENQVLDDAHKIRHIPCHIIHGRYDMVCPLAGAWALHQALPSSTLRIVRDAGHSDREAGMIDALILSSNALAGNTLNAG